jgi:hypothetical protein
MIVEYVKKLEAEEMRSSTSQTHMDLHEQLDSRSFPEVLVATFLLG